MPPEDTPRGVLKTIEILQEGCRKLLASHQSFERVIHVKRGCYELPRAHGSPVGQGYARRFAVLDDDTIDVDLRLERPAGGNKSFHQPARQIERTALAELVAAFQIEGADHRAHRRSFRKRVHQPGAEQGYLEQKEELDVLVFEQFAHDVERLTIRDFEKFAPEGRAREKRFALLLRKGLGIP